MNNYELVFILDKEDDDKLKSIDTIITNLQGKVTNKKFDQKRDLAYPINKQRIGYFYTWFLNLDKSSLKKLTQKFNLENIMLRYLILKVE